MSTPHCPFCLENNLLKGTIVAETESAFLIPALGSERNYLIIPKKHAESPTDIPVSWWGDVARLLPKVPGLLEHYNLSMNIGEHAGQTVKHVHLWVIPRHETHAAQGKGLATLIDSAYKE